MTDRKLSIEDIEEPAKERVEFIGQLLRAKRYFAGLPYVGFILLCSDLWTSQHPIVPSEEQERDLYKVPSTRGVVTEWQRRMYLRKEPALPEGVKAIMRDHGITDEEAVGKIVMLMRKDGK